MQVIVARWHLIEVVGELFLEACLAKPALRRANNFIEKKYIQEKIPGQQLKGKIVS